MSWKTLVVASASLLFCAGSAQAHHSFAAFFDGAQWFEDAQVLDNNGARFIHWRKQPGNYVFPYDCDPSLATEYRQLDKPAGK